MYLQWALLLIVPVSVRNSPARDARASDCDHGRGGRAGNCRHVVEALSDHRTYAGEPFHPDSTHDAGRVGDPRDSQLWADQRRADLLALFYEFKRVLIEELDYVQEARNALIIRANFAATPGVYIPEPYPKSHRDAC